MTLVPKQALLFRKGPPVRRRMKVKMGKGFLLPYCVWMIWDIFRIPS